LNNIVSGLNAIHQQGYLHKDIQDENVVVVERDRFSRDEEKLFPILKFIKFGESEPAKNPYPYPYPPKFESPYLVCIKIFNFYFNFFIGSRN
jgi:serine/threonine protein kinase